MAKPLPGGSTSPKVTVRPSRIRHVDSTPCEQGLQDRLAVVPGLVDASVSPFLCVRALADVAASWTSMAIIEQCVRKQGFWVEEVSSWSVQRHKSAEKQEGECRRMRSSEIWTLQTTKDLMVAGWKWWQMALHNVEECS